ncbi:MAG: D-alanyl-D-alanine carboxypeptidase/D-alanyl-D-alanine-endopeptidase [Hydrogenothermaceae bacterium]
MWIFRVLIFISLFFLPVEAQNNEVLKRVIDKEITDILRNSDISPEDVGIYVKSLTSGEVIYNKNGEKLFIPASNQKIITTASALLMLGPEFRFETKFLTDGVVKSGILEGNLYILGGYNPELKKNYYWEFVKFLKDRGISKIDGNIIVFSKVNYQPKGWPENDLNYCFTAPASDIPIDENCLKVRVVVNKGVNIFISPDGYVKIVNQLTVSRGRNHIEVKFEDNELYISGNVRDRVSEEISLPIKNPAVYNLLVFAKILHQNGINFNKVYVSNSLPPNLTLIYSIKSSPLRDIIKKANKDSNNFIAEQLFLYLGKDNILKAIEKMNISSNYIDIFDGSGLSRYNRVSPKILGEILDFMYKTPYFEDFFQSLAVGGKDGTLKHRFSELAGKVYAKTGYIKGVKNLSGYAISVDGQVYIFSILVNNLKSTKPANDIQESVCKVLVNSANVSKLMDGKNVKTY